MTETLSLVLFTLLAQLGIGLALAAQALGATGELAQMAALGAVGAASLGLAVASSHLGRPLQAFRAISNLRSSWLSRECLFLGGFLGLGLGRLLLERTGASAGSVTGLGWLWNATGLLSLVSMASIYGRTAIPAWKLRHTHVAFHTATLALGGSALALLGAMASRPGDTTARALALVVGAAVVQVAEGGFHWFSRPPTGLARRQRLQARPLAGGLAFTLVGGGVCPLLALRAPGVLWPALAVACLGLGQALLRFSYYASGVHPMATGWADIEYRPAGGGTR